MQNIWRFGLIFHVDHLFHLKGNTDFFFFLHNFSQLKLLLCISLLQKYCIDVHSPTPYTGHGWAMKWWI